MKRDPLNRVSFFIINISKIAEKEDSRKHPSRDCAGGQERERDTRHGVQERKRVPMWAPLRFPFCWPFAAGELFFLGGGFLVGFEEGLLDVGGDELVAAEGHGEG